MKKLFSLLVLCLGFLFVSFTAHAQVFFSNTRVGQLTHYHSTVGTSTAVAIPSASVIPSILSFKICNDAVNTSTYLLVGKASDVSTDGIQLDKGKCFECPNCTATVLKSMKVKGQASSNGYSVIQYRQQ